MLNEGVITNDTKSFIKSAMLRHLWAMKLATPKEWERRVFEDLTQAKQDEVDFGFEDNQAGYYTWVRAFDQLIQELIEDGYVKAEDTETGKVLSATQVDPPVEFSHLDPLSR